MSTVALDRTLAALLLVLPALAIVFARGLNREPSPLVKQSSLLAFPLVSGFVLLYLPDNEVRKTILAASQTLMIMGMLVLRLPSRQEAFPLVNGTYLLSMLPLLLLIKPEYLLAYSWPLPAFVFAGVAAVLAIIAVPRFRHDDKRYTAAFVFLAGAQLCLLPNFPWPNFPAVFFHAGAYLLLFQHFYHSSLDHIRAKSIEADAKLLEWERSIRREVNKRIYEIEKSNSRLIDMAKVDPMTGVYNKVNIVNIITALTQDRQQRRFSILMFDIDNFKQINDTRGHLTGDMIIKQVANTACSSVRGIDSIGRYGGDEFIIVLPHTNSADAKIIAERLRKKVAENQDLACTLSIGIAAFPEDGSNARDLIQAADEGLYISKQRGRNTVSHRNSAQ